MIGLKRGTVKLCNHEKEWELEAQRTISRLNKILGTIAIDIQHVGSTSIPTIKAKPIIDIVVAVDNPVMEYKAHIIGIAYRHNDVEDKLVAAPVGINFSQKEIEEAICFQEKYYESEIEKLIDL